MAKYRLKTEEEFKRDGFWRSHVGRPENWNEDMCREFYGKEIPSEFEYECNNGLKFNMTDSEGNSWVLTKKDVTLCSSSSSIPKVVKRYRFKTEEEFRKDRNWQPQNWYGNMFDNLGKEIPSEFNYLIERGESFNMQSWNYSSRRDCVEMESYVKTDAGFVIHKVNEFKM